MKEEQKQSGETIMSKITLMEGDCILNASLLAVKQVAKFTNGEM